MHQRERCVRAVQKVHYIPTFVFAIHVSSPVSQKPTLHSPTPPPKILSNIDAIKFTTLIIFGGSVGECSVPVTVAHRLRIELSEPRTLKHCRENKGHYRTCSMQVYSDAFGASSVLGLY